MAYLDEHRSPIQRARRERELAAMREKYQRTPPRARTHTVIKTETTTQTVKAQPLTPKTMAHAIRIAAKMAAAQPDRNPLFVEALEVAATYFDDL